MVCEISMAIEWIQMEKGLGKWTKLCFAHYEAHLLGKPPDAFCLSVLETTEVPVTEGLPIYGVWSLTVKIKSGMHCSEGCKIA